jgi:hypothetical protein
MYESYGVQIRAATDGDASCCGCDLCAIGTAMSRTGIAQWVAACMLYQGQQVGRGCASPAAPVQRQVSWPAWQAARHKAMAAATAAL